MDLAACLVLLERVVLVLQERLLSSDHHSNISWSIFRKKKKRFMGKSREEESNNIPNRDGN